MDEKNSSAGGQQDIRDTDIVFECPYCSKSLAIDYRAAGLTIPCSDCGKLVVVPIPEGMEVSDFDTNPEDQAALIIHLREALQDTQSRARLMESMLENCKAQRREQELRNAEVAMEFEQFSRDVENIGKAIEEIKKSLASMSRVVKAHSRQEP